jgi:hypothetical protein
MNDRGQTVLDFAVGVSVFLIVVAFVFAFIPGTLDPFTTGGSEEPVVANRVADSLAEGMLGAPENPNVLDSTCTLEFFEEGEDGAGSVPSECRFEGGVALTERVGIEGRGDAGYGVRISLIADLGDGDRTANTLCHDGSGIVEADPGSCSGTPYAIGSTPPSDTDSVSVSRRAVYLSNDRGTGASLLVEVW